MELFQTVRTKVLKAFQDAQVAFVANTLPYHSTRQLVATVVQDRNDVAFAVFAAGQEMRFFSYGLGDQITLGPAQTDVTEADTNLAKGLSTNGASDVVIEGFALHARGLRVQYPDVDGWGQTPPTGIVLELNNGGVNLYDPAAIVMPPQAQSPFNLEDGLLHHLAPLVSVEAEWDRKTHLRLGTLDLLPRGGAGSMLRSNGLPTSDNRFLVPEGLLWRRDGQHDSEFCLTCKLERALVVPISLVQLPGGDATDVPSFIYVELVARLFGLSVQLPSAI
jgi:hypothetical protein